MNRFAGRTAKQTGILRGGKSPPHARMDLFLDRSEMHSKIEVTIRAKQKDWRIHESIPQ